MPLKTYRPPAEAYPSATNWGHVEAVDVHECENIYRKYRILTYGVLLGMLVQTDERPVLGGSAMPIEP